MRIHYSILILLVFYLYTNMLIPFLLLMACIILHELGHMLFIMIFGGKVKRVNLNIFGGRIDCTIGDIGVLKNIIINLGGIMVNMIIYNYYYLFKDYAEFIKTYNYLLIVFNILPIYPLDGYRIIDIIISELASPVSSFSIISYISILFLIGFLIASLILSSVGLLLIGIFLVIKNIQRIRYKDRIVLQNLVKLLT